MRSAQPNNLQKFSMQQVHNVFQILSPTFEATIKRLVSGLIISRVLARCVPSILETQCTRGPVLPQGFSASVTMQGPQKNEGYTLQRLVIATYISVAQFNVLLTQSPLHHITSQLDQKNKKHCTQDPRTEDLRTRDPRIEDPMIWLCCNQLRNATCVNVPSSNVRLYRCG